LSRGHFEAKTAQISRGYGIIPLAMGVEDLNNREQQAHARGKFHFSATEVAAYLKKGQASQEDIDRKDEANRLDLVLEARMLGKTAQEQILRHYEFSKATPEEKKQILAREQERLWHEQPFTAALISTVDIINNRIIEGGNISAIDVLDKNFSLSADFVDSTDKKNKELWTLYVDYNWENPDKKRIAIRDTGIRSKRLGFTFYPNNINQAPFGGQCDVGIGLVEGNNFRVYNNGVIFGRWDRKPSRTPINKEEEQRYIATMRLYLDNCLNFPSEVKLKSWESPQLKQRIKETK
jgi:hypothetical protein